MHSIIDQKSKQVIAIANLGCLINGDGQIFASTAIDIFALHPINTDVQLEKLIKEDRLEEALLLANNVHISSSDKEKHKTVLQNLQNKVALKRFAAGQFYEFLEFTDTNSVEPEKVLKTCILLSPTLIFFHLKPVRSKALILLQHSLTKIYAEKLWSA